MCTEVTFLSRLHIGIIGEHVTGLSLSHPSRVYYAGWVCVWSVEVIMFSHPHLLSAAAAGWPGVAGAVSGQWESAWWLGRSLQSGETWKSRRWRKKKKSGNVQRMVSRMPEVKHTGITCIIKGSLMLCFQAWPYSLHQRTHPHTSSAFKGPIFGEIPFTIV